MSFDDLHKSTAEALAKAVDDICGEFVVSAGQLEELTGRFIEAMALGLELPAPGQDRAKGLPMLPSFVTGVPDGSEQGVAIAAVLGGTNFRVCSVHLNGDHTYSMKQMKNKIPEYLLEDDGATSKDLFSFLAKRTVAFFRRYFPELFSQQADRTKTFKMGFTFSYPVDQTSLNSGSLIRWTKGFDIPDAVGKDVVQLFQYELEEQGLGMINIVALANDTVGTLLSHCYASSNNGNGEISEPVIGCIFGTGTNGCYLEDIANIKKLPIDIKERLLREGQTQMAINTEWGSFDNACEYLPTTKYDVEIDQKFSPNPGFHLFEKRVSGMYLGEVLRNVMVDLHARGLILNQYRSYKLLPHRLKTPFELSSEVMSHIEIDRTSGLRETELSLLQGLRLPTTPIERQQIQRLVRAISRRSAYLSAVPIAAILMKTGALDKRYHGEVEVGCDGSVVEFYPGYRSMMRHALALSPIGTEGERKVHLCIAKDGSGVGAALCALIA